VCPSFLLFVLSASRFCPVCRFEYQVRRSQFAQLLTDQMFLYGVVAVLLLFISFLFAYLLLSFFHLLKFDVLGYVLQFLTTELSYRSNDIYQPHHLSRYSNYDKWYQCGYYGSQYPVVIDKYFKFFRGVHLPNHGRIDMAFYCNGYVADMLDMLVLAVAVVSTCGIVMHIWTEIHMVRMRQLLHLNGNNNHGNADMMLGSYFVLILSIMSITSGRNIRIGVFIGILITCKECHRVCTIWSRGVAQRYGEVIIEPSIIRRNNR
jgi:hypothetical protein